MRTVLVFQALSLILAGCNNGDTGFTNKDGAPTPVSGDAVMEVSATELAWIDMDVGQTYSKQFTLTSVGEIGGAVFYLPEVRKNDQIITKGDSVTMTLTASLTKEELREGSMRIKSNDATTVELMIPLSAAPLGWSGGSDSGSGDSGSSDSGTATN
jgi:hypothetical protein